MTRKIDSSIFREYDIRGEVGKTLFEDDAYNIGRAFATYVLKGAKSDKIVTCYDGRISSPAIEKRLVDGIKSTGADVIRIGMGPTQCFISLFTSQTRPVELWLLARTTLRTTMVLR